MRVGGKRSRIVPGPEQVRKVVESPLGPGAPGGGPDPGSVDPEMKRGRAVRCPTRPPPFRSAERAFWMGRTAVEVAEGQAQVGGRIERDGSLHSGEGSGGGRRGSRVGAMAGTLIVLGTAQDGGNPQLGSRGRGRPRLVSSVAVVMDDGSTLLADVSPDVKAQVAQLSAVEAYQARSTRNAVDHITLTHGHMGHYTGLVQFGKEAHNADRIPTWVTPSMAAFLTANEPWRSLVEGGHLDLRSGFGPVVLEPGLSLRLVPVPHRAELTDTVGISINDEVLFVPDIDSWADWPDAQQEVARHRVCLLDASFSSLDEIPGRDLGQIPHPLVSDTIERFGHLAADRRLILTHLNHSNPVAEPDSDAAAVVRSAGFEIAEDLMEIHLDGN